MYFVHIYVWNIRHILFLQSTLENFKHKRLK